MRFIAHRAGTDVYPEQSMMAARYSLVHGADLIEMDVRLSKDGIPIICHDPNAQRVFGVDRNIGEMTLAEFMTLRNKHDPAAATYTLEIALAQRLLPALLHIKCDDREQRPAILDLVRKYGAEEQVVFGIGDPGAVAIIKAFDPRIRVLAFMHTEDDLDAFLNTDCEFIRLWEMWLTQARIDRIHACGKEVWVMSGSFDTVGYTNLSNLKVWASMNVNRILINEICKAQAFMAQEG